MMQIIQLAITTSAAEIITTNYSDKRNGEKDTPSVGRAHWRAVALRAL